MTQMPDSHPTTWPLIGRGAELERIDSLRRAQTTCGVIIEGAAGVGKSRLAREALRTAEESGALVEWVQATSSAATVPLAAFSGLLATEIDSDDPLELMRRSSAALRARAGRRQLVLGVDDAQLLDPASAALIQHLASTGSAFVLITARRGEPRPDAIVSLWKDSGAERVSLDVLGERETARLVEAALDGPASQGTLEWLVTTSAGNALFLSEMLCGAIENGALAYQDGLWRLREPEAAVSTSLMDLILDRTKRLSTQQQHVLELLALAEPLPLGELTTLSDPDVIAGLEEQSMIAVRSVRGQSTAVLAHPLYSEVIRASMPAARGRIVRVRLAHAFQERGPLKPDEALRVVTWLLEAGEPAPGELLLDAARAALAAGDTEMGSRLTTVAIDSGAGAEGKLELARCHVAQRRFDEAEDLLSALEGRTASQETAMSALEMHASVLFWERKDPGAVRALLTRARDWHESPSWARRLQSLELRFAALSNTGEDSATDTQELLADAMTDGDLRRRVEPVQALQLFLEGRAIDARTLARRACPSIPLTDQAERVAFASWVLIALETGGEHEDLETELSDALVAGVRAGDHVAAGLAALGLGTLGERKGRLKEADRWLAEAELHFQNGDAFGAAVIARATATWVAHFSGQPTRSAAGLRRCEEALGGNSPLPIQLPYVVRARAWALVADGHSDRAQELLLLAADDAADTPVYAASLAYEAMRTGANPRAAEQLVEAAGARTDAPLARACIADLRGRSARDATVTLAAAEELVVAGAVAYGAEAALAAASLYRDEGRPDSARRAVARARALHFPDQGRAEPHLEGVDGPVIGLTRRESQLVALAAEGLSNADIAEKLVLSVRTVESHLYRAMQKLGVRDRHELAEHLPHSRGE